MLGPMDMVFILMGMLVLTLGMASINGQEASDPEAQAAEILEKARKAIYQGKKKHDINSLSLSMMENSYGKTTMFLENGKERTREERMETESLYSLAAPEKMRIEKHISNSPEPAVKMQTNIIAIANGEKVSSDFEMLVNGQKFDLDMGDMGENKDFAEIFSSQGLPVPFAENDTKRALIDSELQSQVFPLLLNNFSNNNPQFKYIGKAEADNKKAYVLEMRLKNPETKNGFSYKQTTRYFLDTKTNLLLMITSERSTEHIKTSKKIYFSNHKVMNGLFIPSKIKEELTTVSTQNIKIKGLEAIKGSKGNKIVEKEVKKLETNVSFPSDTFKVDK